MFGVRDGTAVADAHREQLGCRGRRGELDRIERNAVTERAEERFGVGQLDTREEREGGLLVPTARRYGGPHRRTAQGADDRGGIEDLTPVGIPRDGVGTHRPKIVAWR